MPPETVSKHHPGGLSRRSSWQKRTMVLTGPGSVYGSLGRNLGGRIRVPRSRGYGVRRVIAGDRRRRAGRGGVSRRPGRTVRRRSPSRPAEGYAHPRANTSGATVGLPPGRTGRLPRGLLLRLHEMITPAGEPALARARSPRSWSPVGDWGGGGKSGQLAGQGGPQELHGHGHTQDAPRDSSATCASNGGRPPLPRSSLLHGVLVPGPFCELPAPLKDACPDRKKPRVREQTGTIRVREKGVLVGKLLPRAPCYASLSRGLQLPRLHLA